MAQADWTDVTGSLSTSIVRRGVSAGFTPPNGGGTYVYGSNSVDATTGVVAKFCNLTNFAPTASGGSIRGAMKRAPSGGSTNFSAFLFGCLQSNADTAKAYMVGLSDDEPGYISLVKGRLVDGIPSGPPGTLGILARSAETFINDTWVHLRLDVIVNPSGDTVLNVYRSDLLLHPVTSPSWVLVPGMSFVDDSIGVNTGSPPFAAGRWGWGFSSKDISRRAQVDSIELLRQQ